VALIFGADITHSQDATAKVSAIANLALVCGALHGDCGGLFPLDEKGNMQGLLDMGVAPELLPGGQAYASARGKFEAAWGVTLPSGGRDALAILEGIETGKIRVLYLAATNPLVTFPDSGRWRKALQKVECLIVQDILPSELTRLAHIVLPGVSFAEKAGSVTSLDQRVNLLNPAIPAVGSAKSDLQIFAEIYQQLLPGMSLATAASIMEEMRQVSGLYGEVCFAGGRAVRSCLKAPFRPEGRSMTCATPVATAPLAAGLHLLSGKILFHFGTTSTHAEGNLAVAPGGYIEMHPADAKACGVAAGGRIKLTTAVGSTEGPVRISDTLPPGLLFAPYHFADINVQQIMPAGSNLVAVAVAKA